MFDKALGGGRRGSALGGRTQSTGASASASSSTSTRRQSAPIRTLHSSRRSSLASTPSIPSASSSAAAAAAASDNNNHDPDLVEAVIFDMDGVLTLSEDISRICGSRVMQKLYGFSDVSPEEFVPFVGTGEANFLSGVARGRGVADPDVAAMKELFFSEYLEAIKEPRVAEKLAGPGARALVSACRAAGLRTAVASAADLVKVDASLDAVGFVPRPSYFDAVVTADAFERLKPAPDAFLAAAAALGKDPKNCVVIEDAPAGVAAARAAGMRVLGVCTTLSAEEMAAIGPDAVRRDTGEVTVEELVALVDSTKKRKKEEEETDVVA